MSATKQISKNEPIESYRPKIHFSPQANWMNDPNGLVFYKGEYHLFYQHNPCSAVWGPMHWGHAVSRDLIHWEHLPIALYPDQNGDIFSGSAVVDWDDSSGLFNGRSGLVAIFTHADTHPGTDKSRQRQSLAYSSDCGRTWTMYKNNPVLVDDDETDFRDPKVFWHTETEKWVLVLVAGDKVMLYGSADLKSWAYLSSFTGGSTSGPWECPDLFRLPVTGQVGETKWVLQVDVKPEEKLISTGAQYFIGEFDGERFVSDYCTSQSLWLDYGKDFYAGVSWSDIPKQDGRRIFIAWMNNWKYANQTPASGWRGIMTVPRELNLKSFPQGLRLVQAPIREISGIAGKIIERKSGAVPEGDTEIIETSERCLEINSEFKVRNGSHFGIRIRTAVNEETIIGYDVACKLLYVDRTNSGITDFSSHFPGRHDAFVPTCDGKIEIQVIIDTCSIEVFADDGRVSITDLIFPSPGNTKVELFSVDGDTQLLSMIVNQLGSS